jgi:hypothetical protein
VNAALGPALFGWQGGRVPWNRVTAERLLPGVRLRRHALWRYSLLWAKPTKSGV